MKHPNRKTIEHMMAGDQTKPDNEGSPESSVQRPNEPVASSNSSNDSITLVKGIVGACLGGVAGYFGSLFLASATGWYLFILPGALAGIGCAALARVSNVILAVVCAAVGVGVSILVEHNMGPFKADPSLGYFITHLHDTDSVMVPVTIALNGAVGVWLSRR